MPAMTLNLSEAESAVVEEMAARKELSKTALIRQALRIYQLVDTRLSEGMALAWRKPDGTILDMDILGMGCGGE